MEGRSGSIKEPIYYPPGGDSLALEADRGSRSSGGSTELSLDDGTALKVPRKFITNWRQACDRTRDRTKDLLKRWRTVPNNIEDTSDDSSASKELEQPGWSVHVWTTWVSRFPSDEALTALDFLEDSASTKALAPIQRDKFTHFFVHLLDHDKDGFIARNDFSILTERLRRFADWSWNGPEYLRLLEFEQGFGDLLLRDRHGNPQEDRRLDLEDWLIWWARVVAPPDGISYQKLPFWLKTLPKIVFTAINRSGSGWISKKELHNFYGCVVGFDTQRIKQCIDIAYDSMTSNGDHPLGWHQYQLVFANYLFGRGPFGPGEHFLGLTDSCLLRGNNVPFPIDYSSLYTPRDKLEVYNPNNRSNRSSIAV
ncbi:uncharacterized protein [Prorops nasuta]|uniref:uncharacterized protein n=1 Tax=Prorops nasuta TaxID=863751 RepID=UPI0034CF3E30